MNAKKGNMQARTIAKIATLTASIGAASIIAVPSAHAQTQQQVGAKEDCAIMVDRNGNVNSQRCSNDPKVLKDFSANATVIIRLFDLPDFGGAATTIYGDGDGCDFAGYRIKDLGHWNNRASSFLTGNGCNAANIHNDSNFLDYGTGFRNPGAHSIVQPFMPPGFDNNVQSIALWRM
ncbi:hypothetical protein ABZ897_08305 [Nonomuraea sp. NPDC046802]|uniref:hypothetical protein n=1 Tax=Nonomuraea sp. NPDC046802 TaxID=3154919 RepID=UPI003402F678